MSSHSTVDKNKPLPGWHHHPELPIKSSPVFTLPLNLKQIALWFLKSWFPLSERLIFVGFAFFVGFTAHFTKSNVAFIPFYIFATYHFYP